MNNSGVRGRTLSGTEISALWDAWTPREVAERMSSVAAPWYVAAGWALELFIGEVGREHSDLEIAVPADRFDDVVAAFPGFEWDVAGDGQVWHYPEQHAHHHQTWLREPAAGRYRLDVFREPHVGDHWVCRRDTSIAVPYSELILRSSEGIPYSAPEVALLFKAKHLREKDMTDFHRVLPAMSLEQRARLKRWLTLVHPGHPWSVALVPPRNS